MEESRWTVDSNGDLVEEVEEAEKNEEP